MLNLHRSFLTENWKPRCWLFCLLFFACLPAAMSGRLWKLFLSLTSSMRYPRPPWTLTVVRLISSSAKWNMALAQILFSSKFDVFKWFTISPTKPVRQISFQYHVDFVKIHIPSQSNRQSSWLTFRLHGLAKLSISCALLERSNRRNQNINVLDLGLPKKKTRLGYSQTVKYV